MSSRPTSVDMRAIQRRASASSRIVENGGRHQIGIPGRIASEFATGNLTKNGGTDYRPKGDPRRVNVHDFEGKKLGKGHACRVCM